MKNTVKKSLSILAVILVCVLVFIQLSSNKAETAKIAELANIKGTFYPVKAMTVESEKRNTTISTSGFLQSETDLMVVSETQGTITQIYKEKGDFVNAGDLIAKVDDELAAAQLSASKAAYEQLKKEVDRFTKLEEQGAVTSQKLEEMKLNFESAEAKYISANRQLEDTRIKAPVSGFIEDDFIEAGQYLSHNTKVCNIIDVKKLKLKIAISEDDYQHLELGQTVEISSSVYPNDQFEGQISYIGRKAGYGNTFDVEIRIVNQENKLKAGMFVSANSSQQQDVAGIYIPRRAVNGSLKDASVYVIENEKAILKAVVTGNVVDDQVQIARGLNSGETIVTEGNYSIFDGATVKVMNELSSIR